jgi:hypothetical protein
MSNNTGGSAFPNEYFDKQLNQERVMHGMTLRDYFAAKAMQALLEKFDERPAEIAHEAYEYADMMLKARGA